LERRIVWHSHTEEVATAHQELLTFTSRANLTAPDPAYDSLMLAVAQRLAAALERRQELGNNGLQLDKIVEEIRAADFTQPASTLPVPSLEELAEPGHSAPINPQDRLSDLSELWSASAPAAAMARV
jgi:hypothetical protein